jgi:hypothetical protein
VDRKAKPQSLLDLYEPMADLFDLIKGAFEVGESYLLSLAHVDAIEGELHDTTPLAAFTLRKVQAMRHVARPGIQTSVGTVVSLVSELTAALGGLAERCRDRRAADRLIDYRDRLNQAGYSAAVLQGENIVVVLE